MTETQIVAIMLVRNEDMFIERIIRNIVEFCDKIIIADHQSNDHTFDICLSLSLEFSKIEIRRIQTLAESAKAIEAYFGTQTWVFGVDGDEIYDPHGLNLLKRKIIDGHFDQCWCVFGNVLNVVSLDIEKMSASGYLAPPSRSMTKLYNFACIEKWLNCTERLHGEEIYFKPDCHNKQRKMLHEEVSWDEAYFRCLHLPFIKRSTRQVMQISKTRFNPDEVIRIQRKTNIVMRFLQLFVQYYSQIFGLDWKSQKYRRGARVEKDVTSFFPD